MLIKFEETHYNGKKEIKFINPSGVKALEQSDRMVRVYLEGCCIFVDGNVEEVAKKLNYGDDNND